MKKNIGGKMAAVILCMTLFTGCGNVQQDKESAPATENESEIITVTESESEAEVEHTEESESISEENDTQKAEEDLGVVIDASMNAVTIQCANGEIKEYSLSEDWDSSGLTDGLMLGDGVKFTLAKEDEEQITALESRETGMDKEALATAGEVLLAVSGSDLEYLSSLCDYPVKVAGKKIGSQQDFMKAYKDEEVFSKDFVTSVLSTSLYLAKPTKDEMLILKKEEDSPGIVIGQTPAGWKVVAINWK